jgi:drug/metabolite transporter (DMT)-like permease
VVGLVQVLASPIIYAVWIVLAARLTGERRDATGHDSVAGAKAAPAAAIMITATGVAYWAGALVVGRPTLAVPIPTEAWPPLLGIGAIASFLAIQTFTEGARRIGAAQAALLSTIEPLWTIALAGLFLGESLTAVQAIGGALILAGVLLSQAPPDLLGPRLRPLVRVADE